MRVVEFMRQQGEEEKHEQALITVPYYIIHYITLDQLLQEHVAINVRNKDNDER